MFSRFFHRIHSLELGAPAPQVTARNQDGELVVFPSIYARGSTLVYFYPKADTPGCTAQACSLRDSFPTFQAGNLQILGVSRDAPEVQKKFQKKYQLPFSLISDQDGKVAEAFGVSGIMGLPISRRRSFLIQDGKIAWISLRAKTGEHAVEVQLAWDALRSPMP